MRKNLLKLLALFLLAVSLAACGLLPEKIDETASWPAGKLYREAKDEMRSGNYEKAIEYYEKLESRYPFGVFAQQAQIDIAYAYYRDNEPAQALAAVERFIKLHPNHPNIDYMYYLRGLINFNDRVGLLNFAFRQDLSERDPKAAQDAFDSFKLLEEINKQASKVNRIIPCLLEIHIAQEESKYGFTFESCREMLQEGAWKNLKNISINGVMGMATNTEDSDEIRKEFKQLHDFFTELKQTYFPNEAQFCEISMGMSHDYPLAIEAGSTLVRVGSKIFGDRIY